MNEQARLDRIRVDKDDLIGTIETNLAGHRTLFLEAMEGYKRKAIMMLEVHIERIKENAPERVMVSLPMPEDHSDDYERALEMLRWSLDDELWLDAHQFDCYVRDQWGWRDQFTASVTPYLESSSPENELRIGGLMRCCTETWGNTENLPTEVGSILQCRYAPDDSTHQMILGADGIWEWLRPPDTRIST